MLNYIKRRKKLNPEVFGLEHIIFLVIFIILTVVSLILIKKYVKTEKTQTIIIKVLAALLLGAIICNRICIALKNNNWTNLIPDTFCGLDSLLLSLALLLGKKNNAVLHFVVYLGFVGGLVTLIYPDFIENYPSIFDPLPFSGLLHHALALYLCILVQVIGWFTPDYKKWKNLVIGFMAYITLGAFLMFVLDNNSAFYINAPILDGTPLTVWVLAPIFAVGYALYMLAYELIKRKIQKNKTLPPTSSKSAKTDSK